MVDHWQLSIRDHNLCEVIRVCLLFVRARNHTHTHHTVNNRLCRPNRVIYRTIYNLIEERLSEREMRAFIIL